MSRVEVTDLVPGEVAAAADVNLTLASWNSGTDAGSINGSNVAVEGIDRRTMSADAHVVSTTASGANTTVLAAAVGPIFSSGALVEITGLQTDNLTFPFDAQVIVHASIFFEMPNSALPQVLTLAMQESSDNGGTWTTMVGTTQVYSVRDTSAVGPPAGFADPANPCPAVTSSASWSVYFTVPAGETRMFQIAYMTPAASPDVVSFVGGTIFTETFEF